MKIIKMPPISVISKAKDDPYDAFYLWVVDKCEVKFDEKKHSINQSAVFMNTENEKAMAKACKQWYYKNSGKLRWYVDKGFSWVWLDYSPSINDSIDSGLMYVDLKKLIVKRRKA